MEDEDVSSWVKAVTKGDTTQIGDLLKRKDSLVNLKCFGDSFKYHALVFASKAGQYEVAQLLLENGAQVDQQDVHGESALMYASEGGSCELAKLLLEKGAQVDLQDRYRCSALMYASKKGCCEVAKLLLEKGAQADLQDVDGWSALMNASREGHYEVVELLLEKGARVDLQDGIMGGSALMYASEKGYYEVAKLLLEKGARVDLQDESGESTLMYASRRGHCEVAKLLLEKGAQVDLQDEDGMSALMRASKKGHGGVVRLLLENGAALHDSTSSAERAALEGGHPEIAQLLKTYTSSTTSEAKATSTEPQVSAQVSAVVTQEGQDDQKDSSANLSSTPVNSLSADPNSITNNNSSSGGAQSFAFETRGRDFTFNDHLYEYGMYKGCSAVRVTSLSGQGGDARLLLEKGASAAVQEKSLQVDLQDEDGQSALMFASVSGHHEVARLLLENGARVDLQDKDGRSALMLASVRGDSEAAALLLQHGAQVDLQDKTGRSALMYASKHAQCDVAELLLDRGADIDLQSTQWESAMSLALSQEQSTLVQQHCKLIEEQAKLLCLLEKKISLLDEGKGLEVIVQETIELVPNSPSISEEGIPVATPISNQQGSGDNSAASACSVDPGIVPEVLLSLKTLSLIKWRDQQGRRHKFRLVAKISSRWRELGRLVGLEEDELNGWESQYRGAPVMCWTRTMTYWLCGGGDSEDTSEYPATWEGLCSLLEDIECANIAKELKKVLSRAISPPPPPPPSSSDAYSSPQKPMPDAAPGPDSLMGKFVMFMAENFHINI